MDTVAADSPAGGDLLRLVQPHQVPALPIGAVEQKPVGTLRLQHENREFFLLRPRQRGHPVAPKLVDPGTVQNQREGK